MRVTIRSGPGAGRSADTAAGRVVVGRDDDCDLVLGDGQASRRHAAFIVGADGFLTVEDLGSTNGTFVNGQRITGPVRLLGGETIRIGESELTVAPAGSPLPAAAPAAPPSPQSRIERLGLRRSARQARTIAATAVVALVAAVAVVILVVTGVIGGDSQATVPQVVEETTPSVVQIRLAGPDGRSSGAGTGWVYDADEGLVVTNAHVARAGTEFVVRVGTEQRDRRASILGMSICGDLALLQVDDTDGMTTLALGSQDDLELGETVVALGYPSTGLQGSELVATRGVVSVPKARSVEVAELDLQAQPNVVQTDTVINAGNSGGPLIDLDAKLVGVNTFRRVPATLNDERYEIQDYALGVDEVKQVIPGLAGGKSLGWIGTNMRIEYVTAEEKQALGLPDVPGILVDGAVEGTTGASAGLGATPLLVVAVDGQPLDPPLVSWCNAVGTKTEGDEAVLSVFAPGETQPQDLTVEFE